MSKKSKIIYFFVSIIFFTLFDLKTSSEILENINTQTSNPLFDLVYIENTGAAFSILQNSRFFLIAFSLIALIWILYYKCKEMKNSSGISIFWTSLLVAGISCNLYERIALGYVRDFFKLNFIDFPVFNISDIFINISVFAIVFIIIKNNFIKKNENNN